jgi:hypothetical protein
VVQRRQRQPGAALHRLHAHGVHHRLCSGKSDGRCRCCGLTCLLVRRRAVSAAQCRNEGTTAERAGTRQKLSSCLAE